MKLKVLIIISVMLFLFDACSKKKLNIEVSTDVEKVVTMNFSPSDTKSRLEKFNGIHPLDISVLIVDLLQKGNILKALKMVNALFSTYPVYHTGGGIVFGYSKPWKIGRGSSRRKRNFWWSCMAQSAVAIALYNIYKATSSLRFLIYLKQVLKPVVTNVDEGGGAIRVGGGKWYLEYVFNGVDENSADFVLNGFLYSLLSIKYLSNKLGWTWLERAFRDGLEGYRYMRERYYYSLNNHEWTLYSLVPLVDPPHYHIFVVELLDSLWRVSGEEIFKNDRDRWIEIFFKNYPFLRKSYLYWPVAGPPYWWWVDIRYDFKIEYSGKTFFSKGWVENHENRFSFPVVTIGRYKKDYIGISILAEDKKPIISMKVNHISHYLIEGYKWHEIRIVQKESYRNGVRIIVKNSSPFIHLLLKGSVRGSPKTNLNCSRLFLEFSNGVVVKKYNPPLTKKFILPISFLSFFPAKKGPWILKAVRLFPCKKGYSIDVDAMFSFSSLLDLEDISSRFPDHDLIFVPHG